MGFGQGLSGLNAASQNLDVIGNNIANSGTVGFKASGISFADVYASSRVGLGTQVAAVNQRFTVGNVSTTGGQFDIAIDGAKGFFRVVNASGQVLYSRNGEFFADKDNYITNAQGQRLTGYPVGGVGMDPVELTVPTGNIAPQATTRAERMGINLDANSPVISLTGTPGVPAVPGEVELDGTVYQFSQVGNTVSWVTAPPAGNYNGGSIVIGAGGAITSGTLAAQPGYQAYTPAVPAVVATPFDPNNPASYTHRVPSTVYDSLGNAHQLVQYMVKREGTAGTSSEWDAYYYMDGQAMDVPAGGGPVQMTFNQSGVLTSAPVTNITYNAPGGVDSPAEPLQIALDYTGTTQFGGDLRYNIQPDGYATGQFASISIGTNGSLVANYTNGQTMEVGTIVLANFNNLQGLQPVGGNAWTETSASGQATLGVPGSNGMSLLKGQALEASNVDMSQELVNMIIAQRTYQANSQTIKTQDQVLQTLMQIR